MISLIRWKSRGGSSGKAFIYSYDDVCGDVCSVSRGGGSDRGPVATGPDNPADVGGHAGRIGAGRPLGSDQHGGFDFVGGIWSAGIERGNRRIGRLGGADGGIYLELARGRLYYRLVDGKDGSPAALLENGIGLFPVGSGGNQPLRNVVVGAGSGAGLACGTGNRCAAVYSRGYNEGAGRFFGLPEPLPGVSANTTEKNGSRRQKTRLKTAGFPFSCSDGGKGIQPLQLLNKAIIERNQQIGRPPFIAAVSIDDPNAVG